ncbi:DNA adenine methylase [Dapis sp. BLCC M126]|uniref:DNA adenine methylase n=1 Tax=Dapis sp. BLCC M126 TaxID=3400189 RepID=UPI003CF91F38
MRKNSIVRPFLKWAGGKRQLLPELIKYIDQKSLKKCRYYEPFIGGGALLFELQPTRAVINDKNQELINCYEVVRDSLDDLIEELRNHQENNSADYFYEIRDLDRSPKEYKKLSKVKKAARIIYLNKTCYNGLFRVNSQGQFNVPFGRYKKPNILDEAVLKAVSIYLNKSQVKLLNIDFEEAVKNAKKGDVIYFDPPYDPISDTASFTGYDANGFNRNEQKRLKEVFDELTQRGCLVILSNSQTDFIMDLYQDYQDKIKIVRAARNINSKGFKRGKIDEIIVLNFSDD